jgi:hypothetical protein
LCHFRRDKVRESGKEITMPAIIMTPQAFFEMFVICLSWQWDEARLTHMWTTVDKVSRILSGLGILSDKQRTALFKDLRTQSLFAMKCGQISSTLVESEDGEKRNTVLNSKNWLVVNHDFARDFSRKRLLRDYRIYLSRKGKTYAESLEAKYAHVITRESYRAECARQEAELANERARAAVSKRYRERVEEET